MKAMISTMSLALSLALAAPAYAQDNAAATAAPAATPTAADADAFIAAVEKDLFDYTVEASQVNWVNATYITDDTDAMAARINAVGTEKSVKYALEAAKYMDVPGLSADTKRKLDILRTGLVLPAPTKPGAATELNTIATDLQSQYGKGRGTLDGKEISGSDIEAEMGNLK
ncbi:MAG: peptidase M2 family protein, partial [Sphingopyxis terrae]